jgi:hypothetical protein
MDLKVKSYYMFTQDFDVSHPMFKIDYDGKISARRADAELAEWEQNEMVFEHEMGIIIYGEETFNVMIPTNIISISPEVLATAMTRLNEKYYKDNDGDWPMGEDFIQLIKRYANKTMDQIADDTQIVADMI